MYWLAMLTMLIDHVGLVFFPTDPAWRIAGRLAFPIYAYALYLGYTHTRDIRSYMLRLLGLALISQVPYMLAFDVLRPNVIWTLLASLLTLAAASRLKYWTAVTGLYVLSALVMELSQMDYGAYGLLLVLIYRYTRSYMMIAAHFVLNVVYDMVHHANLQHFSLLSSILIACFATGESGFYSRVPRWLWRSFYPVHLAVIAAIRIWP
ncbi:MULTISPECIES: TraX family protein [Paenibacillus]|uniref:Conjugal transfer protein TraX n=1 Tax=Paenibacillus peoriae TaxID=59893 RepID=A0A7H0YDL8_9BACL|nr:MULTISPECIES: TraX family protein [Paenibacillus]KAF6637514.1 conjugal transfer protein TraX [Paenibacillus sp. EKM208P]KOS03035.1 conjugal transfer protein TraX [Paenibacillus polymyxa]QNR69176.1 conjugal transfer protein TraX [Paenibacillus peoriae]